MSRKKLIKLVLIGIFFFGFNALIWAMVSIPAAAQCGSNPPPDSSCYTCHIQQILVYENGVWHGIHANKDCCAKCHGGNCSTMDKDLAHQDVIANPLSDIYTNCHSCHPNDYSVRAVLFATELGITPGSIPTPTPFPTGRGVASPLVILPSPVPGMSLGLPFPLILGGLGLVILFLFGLNVVINHIRA